jgi:hypothetical protein
MGTWIHESGHAIMTLLTGGRNHRISLFKSGGGLQIGATGSWLSRALVLLAGYPFASFVGFALLYAATHGLVMWAFIGCCVLVVMNVVFWVRNLYGFLWMLSLTALFAAVIYFGSEDITRYFVLTLGYIISISALKSAWTILKLSFKKPKEAGDATFLREVLKLPALLWGTLFFLQALYFAYVSAQTIFIHV